MKDKGGKVAWGFITVGFLLAGACFVGAVMQFTAPPHESHDEASAAFGGFAAYGRLLVGGVLSIVGAVFGVLSLVAALVIPGRRARAEQVRAYNEAASAHNEAVRAHYAQLGVAPPQQLANPDHQVAPSADLPEARAHFRAPGERNGK